MSHMYVKGKEKLAYSLVLLLAT